MSIFMEIIILSTAYVIHFAGIPLLALTAIAGSIYYSRKYRGKERSGRLLRLFALLAGLLVAGICLYCFNAPFEIYQPFPLLAFIGGTGVVFLRGHRGKSAAVRIGLLLGVIVALLLVGLVLLLCLGFVTR